MQANKLIEITEKEANKFNEANKEIIKSVLADKEIVIKIKKKTIKKIDDPLDLEILLNKCERSGVFEKKSYEKKEQEI
ncbi:MAG: hypothetical protein KAI55_01425 [Candidatus Aenigmarchaeota archaeon]|nr:hypothetical protein [Candidatus Aenigmarchaeota archaeon]